ncbi:SH3 domain-containing protein [Aggregatilineales bacterium SYSU G02658]
MTDNLPNIPSDDDFDDLNDLDWLKDAEVAPLPDDTDPLFDDKSENVYRDRDRDAGIGQAQYGRLAQRRIENAIEKAEEAEFGDPNQMLDWMRAPEVTDQDLPEWLRTPTDEPPPSWLQGISFDAPTASNTDWLKNVSKAGSDVPFWSPPAGDTGGLIAKSEALQNVDTGGLKSDTGWLENADFSGQRPATGGLKPAEDDNRYDFAAFGLANVEPLRTEEAPAVSLEDVFPQVELPTEAETSHPTEADADWDDLMTLFDAAPPPDAPPAPALDLSEEFFNLSPMEPAEADDDLDLDALLAIDPSQPASLGEQLNSALDLDLDALLNDIPDPAAPDADLDALLALPDDEAATTLPRSDFAPASTQTDGVDAALPEWMLEANPFAEATPDWLSEFDQPAVPEDPLANLDLPEASSTSIRNLSNLESRGESPDWLSRLDSDELPDLPTTEPTFGGRSFSLSSGQIDDMLTGSDDDSFEALVQSLSDEVSDPRQELDDLLAAMRAEHELGDDRITSYQEMFDSDLFDKRSIAELDDDAAVLRGTGNLDDLFASGLFDTSEIAALEADLPVRADLSEVFDGDREDMLSDIDLSPASVPVSESDLPLWFQGAQAGMGGSTLAAALRAKQDRPLAELDERLLALREDVLNVKADQDKAEGLIAEILPGVPEALTAAPVITARPELAAGLTVTDAHLTQAALLASLVSEQGRAEAARQRSAVRVPVVRLLVLALLAAAIILPMSVDVDIAPRPLAAFAGEREAAYVAALNTLERGDLVLLAVEYDATHAYELDALTVATLTHLKLRGARPVVISSNSIGILRTKTLLEQVFPDGANRDYFLTRLIASGVVGLRDLANNAALLNLDASGAPNGLSIARLEEFAVGVLISASVEVNRTYAEQVIPQIPRPFLLASTFAALPPSIAYYTAGQFDGVLAGYRDTVVYEAVLNAAAQALIAPPLDEATEEAAPADQPTLPPPTPTAPPPTPTVEATAEAPVIVPVEATATRAETEAAPILPTATLLPSATPIPPTEAATTAPIASPTPISPTSTPTRPALSPTPSEVPLVLVGTIIANDTINVRAEPNTSAPVLTTLRPGTVIRALNFNEDRTWVSVVLPDNRIGWVAAFLIRVEERPITDTPFQRLPAVDRSQQQPTPEPLIQVGTVVFNTVDILDAPASDAEVIGQAQRGDQLRVLLVEGEYASVVLPDNRIGFVDVVALEVRTRQAADAQAIPAPGLTVVPPTPTTRPTNTPRPTSTPTSTPTLTPTPTPIAPVVAAAAPPEQATVDGGARWQSQFFGVMAAIALILVGNIYYLLRAILNRRRRPA